MNWVEVEIEDNCNIFCAKCTIKIAELKNVEIYGSMCDYNEGPKSYIFLRNHQQANDKFVLDDPLITNEKTLFLMYLQRIRCSTCLTEIGIYFKTVNIDNQFALKRYALNVKFIQIEEHHEITLTMFEQALVNSMESLTKRQFYKQQEVSKLGKYSIVKTINTIEDSYARLLKFSQAQLLSRLKEQIEKQKQEGNAQE